MALTKSNFFFTSFIILLALFGVALGVTVHKVGDSSGWTMMGENYQTWASSRTFQVGDSLVFKYIIDSHDVTQVTLHDFEVCDQSNPIAKYETGSDTITLTKPGVHYFICGIPGHCELGQKLQILVLPVSLGPVAAPVPGPVRSAGSSLSPSPSPLAYSPVNHAPYYQMAPSPAPHYHMAPSPAPHNAQMAPSPSPHNAASDSKSVWRGISFVHLLFLFILV